MICKKLYLLERTDKIHYDEYDSVLVRAVDEESARKIAIKHCSGEYMNWNDGKVICNIVKTTGKAGVIISSFNAGL